MRRLRRLRRCGTCLTMDSLGLGPCLLTGRAYGPVLRQAPAGLGPFRFLSRTHVVAEIFAGPRWPEPRPSREVFANARLRTRARTCRSGMNRSEARRLTLMTDDHGTGITPFNNKDVLQFAPNFTVYVIPPDVVCLYSEDRKFLLHGELYCALASAIGEGGKSVRDLARELERHFPSDIVKEALKRLIDRRYVLAASDSSAGVAAAYWASLGLSPETAETNLQNCRVGIQAIDVEGAPELGAALGDLGVRVVKRSPNLTVTLVSDYLEGRLAELNREHLSDGSPWVLVQPSGIFPLVGPVFRPGESACWTCLADRMKRNREIRAHLDLGQARCVAVFASRPAAARTDRHPACSCRNREGGRERLSHTNCAITSSASICSARPS